MENRERMRREAANELCRILEQDLRNDPNCPRSILMGLDVLRAVDVLREKTINLCGVANSFVHIGNVDALRELEQYIKLVTEGIRQYLATIRKDGVP